MYIQLSTQKYPVTQSEIRSLFTNTSFPEPFSPPEDYAWVFPTPRPQYNQTIQYARESAPEYTNKNVWEQRWEVVSKFAEYTDDAGVVHTVEEQEAAAIAQDAAVKAENLKIEVIQQTQKRLDDFAKTRNYDGILSAATYATSTVPKFAAEGQYAVEARDQTWSTLYEIMAEVEAGTRPMPAGYSEIESELPVLAWPV